MFGSRVPDGCGWDSEVRRVMPDLVDADPELNPAWLGWPDRQGHQSHCYSGHQAIVMVVMVHQHLEVLYCRPSEHSHLLQQRSDPTVVLQIPKLQVLKILAPLVHHVSPSMAYSHHF